MAAKNISKGDRVALFYGCEIEAFEVIFATLRAGAAFVPLSPLLAPDALGAMVSDCEPKYVFCSERFEAIIQMACKDHDVPIIAKSGEYAGFIRCGDDYTASFAPVAP